MESLASTPIMSGNFTTSSIGSSADSKQTALESCVARVRQVIQRIKLKIPNGNVNLNRMICPIAGDIPKDLIVTNCGHIFDREAIQKWKDIGGSCALCKTPISTLSPVHELRNLINQWQQEDPILTCSNFKNMNPQRAAKFLQIGKSFTEEKDYEGALESYSKALQYTKSSTDYAAIPALYDQLEEPEKATLSRLYLSLYQLQEAKFQEAINTLELCKSTLLNKSSLVIGLTLQLSPSSENISWAMTEALNQKNSDDSIFIYKQVIAHDPTQVNAYNQLIPLIKDPKEKTELLLKVEKLTHAARQLDLERIYSREAAIIPISPDIQSESAIYGPEAWKIWQVEISGEVSEAPQIDWAEKPSFLKGKPLKETCMLVFIPERILFQGKEQQPTLNLLEEISGQKFGFYNPSVKKEFGDAPIDSGWVLMTKDVIPNSRSKSYDQQKAMVEIDGFRMPGAGELVIGLFVHQSYTGEQLLGTKPLTYSRAEQKIERKYPVFVGGFGSTGLLVNCNYDFAYDFCGTAALRKF